MINYIAAWLVAKDMCQALGIGLQANVTRDLDDDEKGLRTMHTPGGNQRMTIINEPGLCCLTLKSRKLVAARFPRYCLHCRLLKPVPWVGGCKVGYGVCPRP